MNSVYLSNFIYIVSLTCEPVVTVLNLYFKQHYRILYKKQFNEVIYSVYMNYSAFSIT